METVQKLVVDLSNPDRRENALLELSKVYFFVLNYLAFFLFHELLLTCKMMRAIMTGPSESEYDMISWLAVSVNHAHWGCSVLRRYLLARNITFFFLFLAEERIV